MRSKTVGLRCLTLEELEDNYNPFIDSSSSVASPVEPSAWMGGFLTDSFCSPAAVYPNTPLFQSEPSAVAGLFGGFSAPPAAQPPSSTGLNVDFDSVFGNKSAAGTTDSAVASPNQGMTPSAQQPGKLVSDDLDSSLANLVGNLGIGNGTMKNDIHWSQPGEKKLTGGNNWQPKMAPSTTWNPATMAPSVMAFPATTPTGMMGYGMPPQMGSVAMMTQPTMMYTQPVMRPANPFGPVSGAQMQFM